MVGSNSSQLDRADQLIVKGKYEEALHLVETLEKSEKLPTKEQLSCQVCKSTILNKLGKYSQALELLESTSQRSKTNNLYFIHMDAIIEKAYSLWRLGRLNQALEILKQNDEILSSIERKEKKEVKKRQASTIKLKGVIYQSKGNHEKALELYSESLKIWNVLNDQKEISTILNNIGVLYRTKGELDKALEYYDQSLTIYKEIGNEDDIATIVNNIGNIYLYTGEIDKALDNFKQCLRLWESTGNNQYTALVLCNIGDIYQQRGDWETSTLYYKESLYLREKIGNKADIVLSLYGLVTVSLDAQMKERAKRYLDRILEIQREDKSDFIDQISRVAEAYYLKSSSRMKDKVRAQELFQGILEEDVLDHSLTITALLNFIELLLEELKMSGDQELLDLIKNMIESLSEIAEHQNSFTLLTKTYLLQSQLALIDLDLVKARILLTQAEQIAEDKNLKHLAMKISNEHDVMLEQLSDWEDLINKNACLKDRLELTRFGELMVSLSNKGDIEFPQLINEEPVMLLILADSGTPLYTKNFLEGSELDGVLVGGFLAAIINFCNETFSSKGSVERIKHQEYTVLLKPKKPMFFGYVIKGQTYAASQKLEAFAKIIGTSTSVWENLIKAMKCSKALVSDSKIMIEDIAKMIFPSKR
ncbi:MAG: tetratricopeptide repeat protein [Candidatus Heimdallarchaeota archaeon]|nr:tetratricopeptide repeat protein [Candidatus Heimdallarchaeota archaeon]